MEILKVQRGTDHYFGSFLKQLRLQYGLSQEQLADRAQIAVRTLHYWESGERMPRSIELENVLRVLNPTPQDRKQLYSLLPTRRGIQMSRREMLVPGEKHDGLMGLIGVGDLLRAMRVRCRWTQDQLAHELGVRRETVTRWEHSQHFPGDESLERICLLLHAAPEEKIALLSRQLLPPRWHPILSMDECVEAVDLFEIEFSNLQTPLLDLYALALKRQLQLQMPQSAEVLQLLLRVQSKYLFWLIWQRRMEEARAIVGPLLDLLSPPLTPDKWWQYALNVASAYMSAKLSNRSQGIRFLFEWLPHMPSEFQPQIWCDMAYYAADTKQHEDSARFLVQAQKAMNSGPILTEYQLWYYQVTSAHVFTTHGRPVEALAHLSNLPDQPAQRFITLIRWIEALEMAGEHQGARSMLNQMQTLIYADSSNSISGLISGSLRSEP